MRFYSVLTCELWSSGEIVSCDVRPNGKLWADEHIYDKRELVLIWSKIILRKNYYFFQVFLMLWTCIKNYVMRMLYEGLLPLFKQCCNTSAQHWRDWLSPCFFFAISLLKNRALWYEDWKLAFASEYLFSNSLANELSHWLIRYGEFIYNLRSK